MKKILLLICSVVLFAFTACEKGESVEGGSDAMVGQWIESWDSGGTKPIEDGDEGIFTVYNFKKNSYSVFWINGTYDEKSRTLVDAYEGDMVEEMNELSGYIECKYTYKNGKFSNGIVTRTITWQDQDHIVLDKGTGHQQYWVRISKISY